MVKSFPLLILTSMHMDTAFFYVCVCRSINLVVFLFWFYAPWYSAGPIQLIALDENEKWNWLHHFPSQEKQQQKQHRHGQLSKFIRYNQLALLELERNKGSTY